jgi:transcriptional regulator with XRE-family HTH domain
VAGIFGAGQDAAMDDPQLHILGDNIRRLRKDLRLTQQEFAERAEIDLRHFQNIEAGKVDAGFKYLLKIQRALGCDWNTMMEGTDEDSVPAMGMAVAKTHA